MTSASYYRLLANHRPVDGDDAKDTAHSAGGQGRQRRRLVRDANDVSPGRRAGDAAAAAARAFVATESSMPGRRLQLPKGTSLDIWKCPKISARGTTMHMAPHIHTGQ